MALYGGLNAYQALFKIYITPALGPRVGREASSASSQTLPKSFEVILNSSTRNLNLIASSNIHSL